MFWLALHFPRLPLEVCSPGDPQQAMVVLDENRVFLCNLAAQAHGIELGATLATAHSIHPGVEHKHRDLEAESQRLHALADTLYRFSGHVSVQAPDCVLLEIGGSLKLFHSHQSLSEVAIELCQTLGHQSIARVAATPWAAIALARSGRQQLEDVALSEAGLELAGVADDVVERFANMGIYTLGPLLNLSSKSLGRRFGKTLLKYLAQLTGDLHDPRKACTPSSAFDQTQHLLAPICDKNDLHEHDASPMAALARALQQWLITRQLGCERLQWQFLSHNAEKACLPVHFAKGKQSAADFMRISRLKLEQAVLPEEVLSIGLSATSLQPWTGASHGLFRSTDHASHDDASSNDLNELIDEFNARLGEGCCRGLRITPQHAPENTWQTLHAHHMSRKPAPRHAGFEAEFLQGLSKRPLWLFDPPRQVSVAELNLLQGPERIQTQWWQGSAACRDYYIAQHRLGAECWAFVDSEAQWYLHGYFG